MNECRMMELLAMSKDLIHIMRKHKISLSERNFVLKMAKEMTEIELLKPRRRK